MKPYERSGRPLTPEKGVAKEFPKITIYNSAGLQEYPRFPSVSGIPARPGYFRLLGVLPCPSVLSVTEVEPYLSQSGLPSSGGDLIDQSQAGGLTLKVKVQVVD